MLKSVFSVAVIATHAQAALQENLRARSVVRLATSLGSVDPLCPMPHIRNQQVPIVAATASLSRTTTAIKVNGRRASALVDSGSINSFIHQSLVTKLHLDILPSFSKVTLASSSHSVPISGHCFVTFLLGNEEYDQVRRNVMNGLCCDVVFGQDFLSQHEGVLIKFDGMRYTLTVCGVAKSTLVTPLLFSNLLPISKPVTTVSRRFSPSEKEFIVREVDKLLADGIIEKSTSPWRAQVVIAVPENHKKRLVIDYSRTINSLTVLDAYPLPRVTDLLETVSKFRVFSTFDLRSAHHQIAIKDRDKPYTAFEANGCLYQFCRLPFGFTNSVACFQRLMNDFIKNNELTDTFAYLDNILVCGMDAASHDRNLERFLKEASRCSFTFNEEKCETKKDTIDFLGFTIEYDTMRPAAERLRAVREYPTPHNLESLRRAVGMIS